jgi:hypothetical protein
MIVDIPEGLPVPIVSSPPTSVLVWNSADQCFLPLVFDFGNFLVHNNGALLLFHKDDLKLRADIRGYANAVATQDRVFPHYVPNSSIKHSKSDSKDRCGSTDFDFFCFKLQISIKTGSLKCSNK